MRLWHYALIKFLPRQQLLSQWRECVCIAKFIHDKGTPNHILVSKIMDYPISEFNDYCNIVLVEMVKRGYNVSESSINKLEEYIGFEVDSDKQIVIHLKDGIIFAILNNAIIIYKKNMIAEVLLIKNGKQLPMDA